MSTETPPDSNDAREQPFAFTSTRSVDGRVIIRRHSHGGAVAGMVLVTIGAIFLGESQHWAAHWNMSHLWPLILIAVGVGRIMATPRCTGSTLWLIGIGLLFLLDEFHILLIRDAWPMFLILGGLAIVFSGRRSIRRTNDLSGGGAQ